MYAACYPSLLHTSKHYAYELKKHLNYLLFLDIFCRAMISQPDVGRPAKRAIPRSNSGLRFRAQPLATRAVTPINTNGFGRPQRARASNRLKELSRCLLQFRFCDIISRTQIPEWTCATDATTTTRMRLAQLCRKYNPQASDGN
jgi:hypothetical protein